MTESGTFLLLPAEVVGLEYVEDCSDMLGSVEVVGFVGDDDWRCCIDLPELSVAVVSDRVISGSAISATAPSTICRKVRGVLISYYS